MFYAIIFNAADEGWCGQDYRGVNFDSIVSFDDSSTIIIKAMFET